MLFFVKSCVSHRGVNMPWGGLSEAPLGFPGGSVMKNLPAIAGDTGSIPDPGRSHMLQSS